MGIGMGHDTASLQLAPTVVPGVVGGLLARSERMGCRLEAALSHWRLFPCAKGTDSLLARFEFAIFSFSFHSFSSFGWGWWTGPALSWLQTDTG